jgi:hypothetical protein
MKTKTKSMRRAETAASTLVSGPEILAALRRARRELIAMAEQSRPPVAAVSQMLLEKFGAEVKRLPVRQFIGLAVRAILEDAGFEVAYSGVKISEDPIFTSGSVYRNQSDQPRSPSEYDDAFERMLKALKPEQATRAVYLLNRYNPHLLDVMKELLSVEKRKENTKYRRDPKLRSTAER